MLSVILADSNSLVSERDLYVPVEKAAFILAYGITGSGQDVVARALSYYAPNSRDWKAVGQLAQVSAELACAGISACVVSQSPAAVSWYMGELGCERNAADELDSLVTMLQAGSQVIAYIHATDPWARLRTVYRDCEPNQFSMFENLITERGFRIFEVVRGARGGSVQVEVMVRSPKMS